MNKKIRYLLAPLAAGLTQGALAGDLIAWWNFDTVGNGIAVDAQAGNVGVLLNGAQFSSPGTGRSGAGSDRAMLFGNDRHRLHVVDATFLNAAGAANAISVSFWQNLTAVRDQTTFWAGSASVNPALNVHSPWSNNNVYWDTAGCCDETTQRVFVDPGATWLSTWNHIVLVKNGDTKRIYVNGVESLASSSTAPLPTDFTELFIGNSNGAANAVDGQIDDFAVFKRELTPAEVTSLSGGASPASLDPSNDVDADGLPDAWELRFAADLTVLAPAGDADSDGLANSAELSQGTKPTSNDTDADGFLDGVETNTGTWVNATNTGTNPLLADTDNDGLKDGAENNSGTYVSAANAGTNPLLTDTDGDAFTDGVEAIFGGSNPTNNLSRPLRTGQLDLLAYWPFNDATDPVTATDVVRGFTGTLLVGTDSTPTSYTPDAGGRTGAAGDRAMDFGTAGANSTGVSVAAGGFLNIASAQNQVAIAFWQKLYSVVNSTSFKGTSPSSSGGERGLSGHATWSDNNFYWDTAGCCDGNQRISGPNDATLVDEWHHFVFQKNGNTKEIWVDGVLKVTGSNPGVLPSDFRTLQIGRDAGAENIAGLIDDFAVYADALTPEQINLLVTGTAPNSPTLVPPNTDTDGDGMQDAWEIANGLNPNVDDRLGDLDSDGVNNINENIGGTLPNNPDSDGDSLTDGAETKTGVWVSATNTGTNPLNTDSDGDSLGDAVETNTGTYVSPTNPGTNPNKADTDGDKFPDMTEIQWPSDPNLKASAPALDPTKLDLLAYWDFNNATNPLLAVDSQHGWEARFFGANTKFSDPSLGFSGGAADRALDLGTTGGNNGANVLNARWFGLGVPPPKSIKNLGSLGSDGDMLSGSGVFGVPGALVGSADTALNVPANLNTRVPFTPALNPSGPWTIEAWLRPAAANPAGTLTAALASGDFASPRKGWLIYQSDTGWNLRTYYSDGLSTAVNITGNNGAAPVPEAWTHVVATWDGSVAKVYVDGALSVTSDPKTYVAGLAGSFNVGSRSDNGFGWNGDADEVAFYNGALGDAVILDHYNNGKAAAPAQPYNTLVLASNPVGYWRMTDSAPGELPPDQVAVSYWQNLAAVSSSSAFWANSPSSSGTARGFQAHVSWGDGNIYFDTAGCCDAPQRISGPGDITVAEWQHFVFQKNGGVKEVWRDGVLILSGENAASLPDDFSNLIIGADGAGNAATQGLIDDFAVFGEALTPDQIARLAAGESPTSLGNAPAATIAFTAVSYNATTSQLTLTWTSQPGKTYTLKTSQTLATWPVELNDSIASGGTTTTYVHAVNTYPGGPPPALYYRVSENP